jgi:hypothetical protein
VKIVKTIDEAKRFLDTLAKKKREPIASVYRLGPPQISKADCRRVERELNVRLPASYRSLLLSFGWNTLNLSNLEFHASAQELIDRNRASVNPFYEFYQAHHLLGIGNYEADPICVGLEGGREGEIFYIDHNQYPELQAEFIASSFERLIVCATINAQIKEDVSYYEWDDAQLDQEEPLYNRVLEAISEVEPGASKGSFWYNFIRGF